MNHQTLQLRKERFEKFLDKQFSDEITSHLHRILNQNLEKLNTQVRKRNMLINKDLDSLDLYVSSLKEQNQFLDCDFQSLQRELKFSNEASDLEMKLFLKKFLMFQRAKNQTDLFYLLWDRLHNGKQQTFKKYLFEKQPSDENNYGNILFIKDLIIR